VLLPQEHTAIDIGELMSAILRQAGRKAEHMEEEDLVEAFSSLVIIEVGSPLKFSW
jgi:uncharacterized protein Veg